MGEGGQKLLLEPVRRLGPLELFLRDPPQRAVVLPSSSTRYGRICLRIRPHAHRHRGHRQRQRDRPDVLDLPRREGRERTAGATQNDHCRGRGKIRAFRHWARYVQSRQYYSPPVNGPDVGSSLELQGPLCSEVVRVAALGDLHCTKTSHGALQPLFARISESADLLLMAGDLTDYGLAGRGARAGPGADVAPDSGRRRARQSRFRIGQARRGRGRF